LVVKPRGAFREIAGVLWSNSKSRIGLIILGIFIAVSIFGPLLTPYNPNDSNFQDMLGPSLQHWLGTTQNGQDVMSELIAGTRISVIVSFSVGAIATFLAMLIGITAGYVSGWVDEVLSFLTNVFLVLPGLPLLIVLASYAPGRGMSLIVGTCSVNPAFFEENILKMRPFF
jgi:peptide/nickel transport system permease protein